MWGGFMFIEHNLLRKHKRRTYSSKVKVDLYETATELYEELNTCGIIQRMQDVPQLGVINVNKKLEKSRYDYTILQLYFHQIIKSNLQNQLEFTYNNYVAPHDLRADLSFVPKTWKPSIADLLQVLTIVYNIGHFYNTFVASRAVIINAAQCDIFKNQIIYASDDVLYQQAAKKMITEANYQRFHLLNSLLILKRCNQSKRSVQLAQELLYAYINEDMLAENNKLHYVFGLYHSVRSVAYVSYDLQIARTPMTIDLCDANALLVLFKELLSAYNDNSSTKQLVNSISKMLDDTVYNEEANAICYYMITERMVRKLLHSATEHCDYYNDYFISKESLPNTNYSQCRDFIQTGILKLTFSKEQKMYSQWILSALSHTNNIRTGYYDRYHGEQTILVSLKRSCKTKPQVAFHVLKIIVMNLRKIPNIDRADIRYLLTTKFFLFYLCGENPIVIKPTVHSHICVICTKGKKQRLRSLKKILDYGYGNEDERHEVNNIYSVLQKDEKNDTCITVPGSILVYEKEKTGKKLCEFDGIILYPARTHNSIVFLEAKNTKDKATFGKACLIEKLEKLNIPFNKSTIEIQDKDAILHYDFSAQLNPLD